MQRSRDPFRISAQLIDATTGLTAGPSTMIARLEDVFAVQDEVVRMIVAFLAAHVRKAEVERTRAKPPNSWQAHDYCLQAAVSAIASFERSFNVEVLYAARQFLQQSLDIDETTPAPTLYSRAGTSRPISSAWTRTISILLPLIWLTNLHPGQCILTLTARGTHDSVTREIMYLEQLVMSATPMIVRFVGVPWCLLTPLADRQSHALPKSALNLLAANNRHLGAII